MTQFGRLNADGTYEVLGEVSQADMLKCPHAIMILEHYRDDGTCRCNDILHREMSDWGYKWDGAKWVAP